MMHQNGVAVKWYSVLHSASLYYMLNSGHHISNITRQYKEKKKKKLFMYKASTDARI